MKNIVDMKLFKFPLFIIALSLSFMLSACLKDKDGYNENVVSALSIVHASAVAPPVDFVLDGQRVNNQAFEYGDRIQYFGVYSGTWATAFYEGNTHKNPLYKTQIQLQSGKYYTLFLAGTLEEPEGLMLEDDVSTPEEGMAALRFVNLSTDAGVVNFLLGKETLASKKDFTEYTGFQAVSAGMYDASVASQDGTIFKRMELDLKDGKIYTVWLKGLLEYEAGAENQKLDFGLIDHSQELQQ